MKHISLFSGIGGFDLAAEWVGWNNVASCEIGYFGHKVLSYYWPEAYHHRDIHDLTYDKLNHEISTRHGENWRTDGVVLSGGFPCQPYSTAGKRKGKEDDRHLWPEMLRLIREIRPDYIVGENVHGLVNWNGGMVFDEVQADLEAEGYEVVAVVLPACAVDAPHRRDRVWFVAHATGSNDRGRNREFCQEERRPFGQMPPTPIGASESNDERWDVADPHGIGKYSGLGQVQGKNEKIPQRNHHAEFGNADKSTTANPELHGHLAPEGGGSDGEDSKNTQEREKIAVQFTRVCQSGELDGVQPNASDTNRQYGRQGATGKNWKETCNGGAFAPNDNGAGRIKERQPATEPNQKERQHCEAHTGGQPGGWERFPTTEPTIRSGNDGLPYRLDGITFSKWRNESIKAYGNAVVPQVVFEIFKAINQLHYGE